MKRCAPWLLALTGCLQPNPKFVESSSEAETGSSTVSSSSTVTSTAETAPDSSSGASDPVTTSDPPDDSSATSSAAESSGSGSTGLQDDGHVVFVSSMEVSGSVGAIEPIDELCQMLATDAGLRGTWLAVVSTTAASARDRIVIRGPVHNRVGELVANDGDDLWDGAIANPVLYDEHGVEALRDMWTGTTTDGALASENCENWSGGGGTAGVTAWSGYADGRWLEFDTNPCTQQNAVYCVSQ